MERNIDGSTLPVQSQPSGENTSAVEPQAKLNDANIQTIHKQKPGWIQGSLDPNTIGEFHPALNGDKCPPADQRDDSLSILAHEIGVKKSQTTKDAQNIPSTSRTNSSSETGNRNTPFNNPDSDKQVSSTSSTSAPPALVNVNRVDGIKEVADTAVSKTVDSGSEQLAMDVATSYREDFTSSRSDHEDSPELVIDTQPNDSGDDSGSQFHRELDNNSESKHTSKRNESRESSLEIYMDVPLEESDEEEEVIKVSSLRDDGSNQTPTTSTINQAQTTTPHLKYIPRITTPHDTDRGVTRPPLKDQSDPKYSSGKLNGEDSSRYPSAGESGRSVCPSYRVRRVEKLKQFFTTLQGFGNKLGSEGAEQVQELITALVNETASIEEFHQEIQTVTNHPLKQFIIPFLRENLGYLRDELKQSSKALSDILSQDTETPSQNSFTLTPQLADDELPVYKTPHSSGSSKSTVGTVISRRLKPHTTTVSEWKNGQRVPKYIQFTTQPPSQGTLPSPSTQQNHSKQFGMTAASLSRSAVSNVVMSRSTTVAGTRMSPAEVRIPSPDDHIRSIGVMRKRTRPVATEKNLLNLSHEKDTQTVNTAKQQQQQQQYLSHVPKRSRSDLSSFPDDIIITSTNKPTAHPPLAYPQPPHTYPIVASTPNNVETNTVLSRGRDTTTLSEDWAHVDMMLTSMQGMMERTRQAVSLLKERLTLTQAELERREMDSETVLKQRVHEAVDKVKQRAEEEKQHILAETRKQMREAAANLRTEIENRLKSTQAVAIQDAVKESNKQSTSKENCWNCGRRATETCSGCNKARYCGTFCQHRDWSSHMHHCASGLQETVYDRRRQQPTPLASNDVTVMTAGRASHHTRNVGVPVNLVQGSGEMNLRHLVSSHGLPPPNHTDMVVTIKTEKT